MLAIATLCIFSAALGGDLTLLTLSRSRPARRMARVSAVLCAAAIVLLALGNRAW
jgi:hypothetical protein